MSMSGSDVDNWSEDQLFQWIEKHNINADNDVSVPKLRMLVKMHLKQGNDDATREEEEAEEHEITSVSPFYSRYTVIYAAKKITWLTT